MSHIEPGTSDLINMRYILQNWQVKFELMNACTVQLQPLPIAKYPIILLGREEERIKYLIISMPWWGLKLDLPAVSKAGTLTTSTSLLQINTMLLVIKKISEWLNGQN